MKFDSLFTGKWGSSQENIAVEWSFFLEWFETWSRCFSEGLILTMFDDYELNSQEECPVSSCALVSSRSEAERADLVIFKDHFTMPTFDRPSYQKWMLYLLGELNVNHVLRGTITIITNPGWNIFHCRVSASHTNVQISFCFQLDSNIQVTTKLFTIIPIVCHSRRDSTVVTPYERWQYYNDKIRFE